LAGLFDRSEEHALLHDVLRRFVREHGDLEKRQQRLRATKPAHMELWGQLAALGALGAAVREDRGGFGGTGRDIGVVQDALAPGLFVEPVLAAAMAAGLLAHAAPGMAAQLEDNIISGQRIYVIAHGEGFDPFAPPAATAEASADGFILRGTKPCVRHADVATDFLITARGAGQETMVFLVPATAPGLCITPTRLIDASGAADMAMDAVRLAAGARLPLGDDAQGAVVDALECGLAGLCAEAASLARAASLATFEYLNTRVQFGTKLAQFQALQHRAADMAIACEEAAAMADSALSALSEPLSAARSRAILAASLACDRAGRRVAHDSIQMFGGMGVSDELVVSHYARRLAAIRAQIGTMDARAARLTALEMDVA
jgi:alkylation response protein AidB-like acyl-CoA dehydrogenase